MEIFQAIILGIVEGLSEFLPISSTGHMILVSQLLSIKSSDFLSSFEICIQLGAILAVVVIYFKRVISNARIIKIVGAAFLPVVFIGLIFYKIIKDYFFSNVQIVLWALFIGGIALIVFELLYKEKPGAVGAIDEISYKQAFGIGLFQCLAIIPGVSRAAASILGGLTVGLKRQLIVEFSFLLAIPTMLAATVLDLTKIGYSFNIHQWTAIGAGFFTSFIVAYGAVKFLLKFIQNHTFISFGVYRMAAAILFWLIILK